MTLETVFTVAAVWLAVLMLACGLRVVFARDPASRLLALDTLAMLLVGLLVSYSASQETHHFVDAALVLALLGFVATLASARYHGGEGPFG